MNSFIEMDEKVIFALEESLQNMSNPNEGLENVNRLINLKRLKYGGIEKYIGYESDLFSKANVHY